MVGGGVAGASGTLASAPGDVLRTRLVAQAEPVYKSIWHAVTQLWKEGGVPAFYKGALPAVMMTAPQAALQFAFYSLFTSLVPKVPLKDRSVSISIPESLSCGGLAGMASKSLLYPLDVAKKRLQVDKIPKGTPKLFSGAFALEDLQVYIFISRPTILLLLWLMHQTSKLISSHILLNTAMSVLQSD